MAGDPGAGHHPGMLSASPLTIRPAHGDDAAALRRLAKRGCGYPAATEGPRGA